MLITIKQHFLLLNGETMSKFSLLSQATFFSLIASCSVSLNAQSLMQKATLDWTIHEYVLSTITGDLNRYTQACTALKEAAKNADSIDVERCLKIALEIKAQHNHGRRIAAGFLGSASLMATINTATHALSHRGDTTPCTVTSTLAGLEAGAMTAYSMAYAIGTIAAICSNDNNIYRIKEFAREVALSLPVVALQWTALYLNSKASKEKAAFDDAHQSLLRSLDATMYRHEKASAKSTQAKTDTAA
jgi:hypothetical protein